MKYLVSSHESDEPSTDHAFRALVHSIEMVGVIAVVKTAPGAAATVARAIAEASLPGVVGTAAADDTVFAVVHGHGGAELRSVLHA